MANANIHRFSLTSAVLSLNTLREQFEKAETHDELWNAGQMEMRHLGKMHGFMRMYWAKKVIDVLFLEGVADCCFGDQDAVVSSFSALLLHLESALYGTSSKFAANSLLLAFEASLTPAKLQLMTFQGCCTLCSVGT